MTPVVYNIDTVKNLVLLVIFSEYKVCSNTHLKPAKTKNQK